MKEIWKYVDKDKLYEGSNTGNIRSYHRFGSAIRRKKPVIIKQNLNTKGYPSVNINGKTIATHIIIATLFVDNPKNKPQVNHKDCNKLNNHSYNLEWVTNQENMDHARKNGLFRKVVGEEVGNSKLTKEKVKMIKRLYEEENVTLKEIGETYNVHLSTISLIVNGKTWTHV